MEALFISEHEVNGPSQLVGQNGKSLALAVFVGDLLQVSLSSLVALEEKLRRFRERPAEMGIADLFAGGAIFLAI